MVETVLVDTDDGLRAGVDMSLSTCCSLLDFQFRQTGLDSLGHTAQFLDFLDMLPGAVSDLVCKALHVVGTAPGIDLLADVGLFLDIDLGVARDTCREVGRQRDGLVEGVGVKRLGVAQNGAHGLDAGTSHIVEGILLGERPSGSLAVRTQRQRFRVLGVELLHDPGPEHTGCTHLGDLHEIVHRDAPEERQTRSEGVDIHAGVHTCAEIFQTVGQRVCQLDVGGSAGLLHMVTGDRDGVELGHVFRGVLEDICDDLHRERRRVDVGVAHHELLEDIVLDGTGHFLELGALFETGVDVECQDGQHGTVHGHRHRHLVQGDAVEEYLHVLD